MDYIQKLTFLWGKEIVATSRKIHEISDVSIILQIMPKSHYLNHHRPLENFQICFRQGDCTKVILNDELFLSFSSNEGTLSLYSAEITSGNSSLDGQFLYQHRQSLCELGVFRRNTSGGSVVSLNVFRNVLAFAVVKNGVFLVTVEEDIEIWNAEMSKCLMKSKLLEAIKCCEPVSDYSVACVGKTKVSFFDSRTLQLLSTTSLSENQDVLTCNSKYDVVVRDFSFECNKCFIMKDDKIIHSLNDTMCIELARFSPDASKLVLYFNSRANEHYSFLEISKEKVKEACRVQLHAESRRLYFLDNNYFITVAVNNNDYWLFLTCFRTKKNVPFFRLSGRVTSMFFNRECQILIVNYYQNTFEEFHLQLPK